MSGFRSDVDRLTARAHEFGDLAVQARRLADDLRRAVEATGECWGADEVGSRFAATHLPASRETLDRVERMSSRLGEMGGDLAGTARTYRDADEANAAALEKSARSAGSGGTR